MKIKSIYKPENFWLAVQMTVALTIVTVFAFLSSCIKAPELKQGDLGPEATSDQLENVISKALYGVNPWKSQVGQQIIYDFNMRVENQDEVRPLFRLTQTIMARKESEDKKKLTVTIQHHEVDANTGTIERTESESNYTADGAAQNFVNPTSEISLTRSQRPFDKMTLQSRLDTQIITSVFDFFTVYSKNHFQTTAERPVKKVTYHNLKEDSGWMSPPANVRGRKDCGGVPNCQMRYYMIDYDEATWYSETEYEMRKWHFLMSRDAPFVGYILERCLGAMIAGQDRRYFVRQCQFARDFSYSGATAP